MMMSSATASHRQRQEERSLCFPMWNWFCRSLFVLAVLGGQDGGLSGGGGGSTRLAMLVLADSSPCVVCGSYGPASLPLPDKPMPDLGIPLSKCVDMETSALFVDEGSSICTAMQKFGTYCGCNKPPTACDLCWDGTPASHQDRLTHYRTSDFLNGFGEGVNVTCETAEAYLHSFPKDSTDCYDAQRIEGENCGCRPLPTNIFDEQPISEHNNDQRPIHNNTIGDGVDEPNDKELPTNVVEEEEEARCSLCQDGAISPVPDKLVDLGGPAKLTCAEYEVFASVLPANSKDCALVRGGAKLCQCPARPGQCSMCPKGERVSRPKKKLNWLTESFLSTEQGVNIRQESVDFLTCEVMESLVASEDLALAEIFGTQDGLICPATQMKSSICGCEPDWKPIALTWSYRTSGILSFVVSTNFEHHHPLPVALTCLFVCAKQGSAMIIVTILRKRTRKKRFTTYHQLVLSISLFDIVSSIAYTLVGVMAPYEAGFYLSRGNDTTCKIQGFMIQLGQTTSMAYNLCLSLYFLLVIVFSWREQRFRKLNVVVHVAVLLIGIGMAAGSLPFIEPQFGVCGILPPLTASKWQVSLFYTGPVCIVLVVLTAVTVTICRVVYVQRKRAQNWLLDKKESIVRKVFWQSFFYVAAFYLTLPFVLLSFYVKFETPKNFWIFVATAILAPLQGFMNAMVYFQRSKGFQRCCKRLSCCGGDVESSDTKLGGSTSFSFSNSFKLQSPRQESTRNQSSGANQQTTDARTGEGNKIYMQEEFSSEIAAMNGSQNHDALASNNMETLEDDDLAEAQTPFGGVMGKRVPQRRFGPLSALFQRCRNRRNFIVLTDGNEIAGVLEYWKLHEEDDEGLDGSSVETRSLAWSREGRIG